MTRRDTAAKAVKKINKQFEAGYNAGYTEGFAAGVAQTKEEHNVWIESIKERVAKLREKKA